MMALWLRVGENESLIRTKIACLIEEIEFFI